MDFYFSVNTDMKNNYTEFRIMNKKSVTKNFWDAKMYSQFIETRTKPAADLLSGIPETAGPKEVVQFSVEIFSSGFFMITLPFQKFQLGKRFLNQYF